MSLRSHISAPPGGVMTIPEGAISGGLVVAVDSDDAGSLVVRVAYPDTEDLMEVDGSPIAAGSLPFAAAAELVIGWLVRDPGVDRAGNPVASDLRGLRLPA